MLAQLLREGRNGDVEGRKQSILSQCEELERNNDIGESADEQPRYIIRTEAQ